MLTLIAKNNKTGQQLKYCICINMLQRIRIQANFCTRTKLLSWLWNRPRSTHCVLRSPSIIGIFSEFSNKTLKHGSTFATSKYQQCILIQKSQLYNFETLHYASIWLHQKGRRVYINGLIHWLELIPACISNHMPGKVWDEISELFPNLNNTHFEVPHIIQLYFKRYN